MNIIQSYEDIVRDYVVRMQSILSVIMKIWLTTSSVIVLLKVEEPLALSVVATVSYCIKKLLVFLQEKTLESAVTYAVETELSLRVRQWEHRIRPILEEEVYLLNC